jgi:hypothetical protein
MRGQDMGCMGNPEVRTPHLDKLASQGTTMKTIDERILTLVAHMREGLALSIVGHLDHDKKVLTLCRARRGAGRRIGKKVFVDQQIAGVREEVGDKKVGLVARVIRMEADYPYPLRGIARLAVVLVGHVEPGRHEVGQGDERLLGVGATGLQVEHRAALGGEGRHIEDALAVDPPAPVIDPDLGPEGVRQADELAGRPHVEPVGVDDLDPAACRGRSVHRLSPRRMGLALRPSLCPQFPAPRRLWTRRREYR